MRLALLATVALLAALPAAAADRVALLIGNNNYAAAPLRNAVNDARDLGAALKELGFTIIVKENATRREMIEAIREFGTALDGASTALFFYAGHAMQFKDRNYLIPIDAAMGSEEDITFFAVEVGQIFDRMDRAKTRFNFLVLDACRDNPFASSFKVSSSGLAQMSSPSGTLIGYATAPGSVAADGYGRNGMYTHHILQNIRVPDLPVEIMFKRVREGVERETKRQQTPWDSSSLKGDFAFNVTSRSTGVSGGSSSGPSADTQLQIEREFWVSVRDSNRADDIQAYLDKYPSGNFGALAKNKLEALLRPTRVAAAQPEMRSGAAASQQPTAAAASSAPAEPAPASAPAPSAASPSAQPAKAAEKPVVVAAAPASSAPSTRPAPATASTIAAPPPAAAPEPAAPKKEEAAGKEIAPGVRELSFSDGSIYRGAMRGTVLHGKGEYVSKSFQYQGEFKDNKKHGNGTYVWENGDRYEGQFVDDRPDGKGKWSFSSGDTYEGEVKAGVIVGKGTSTTKSGDSFDGSFIDGKPQGTGVYRFASGDRYEGEMSNGRMNGQGRYIAKDGYVIQGRFKDGQAQGPGTYTFTNGDRYEGEIRNGALTGQGAYFYANGLKYEGEMADGLPRGKGVFWFNDGTRFEGQFEGLAKAKGEVVKADGARVPAEMVDGNVRWLN